ncbi:MAG: CBS domain-containing protein [Bacillota bacterium]
MRVLVKDVMSRGVLKLKKSDTIQDVARLFVDRVIDGAPVVDDNGKIVGVFTKTHLLKAFGKPLDTPVEKLMNKNIITIGETMPVEEALNIPVGRLPVVNENGVMVGWLTRTDLAFAFLDNYKKAVEGLETIFDSTYHGLLVVDGEGVITQINRSLKRMWNFREYSYEGLHVSEVFPGLGMDHVLKTGEPILGLRLEIRDKLNTIDITPIVRQGAVEGAVAVVRQENE